MTRTPRSNSRRLASSPARWIPGLLLALAGCAPDDGGGGRDDTGPDEQPADARSLGEPCDASAMCASATCAARTPDEVSVCTQVCGDAPCPAGFACVEGGGGAGYCFAGGDLGGRCTTDGDCASGRCVGDSLGVEGWCSRPCDDDCPDGFRCAEVGGERVCHPQGDGATGDACEANLDCASDLCVFFAANVGFCTETCDVDDSSCPMGFVCEGVCLPEPLLDLGADCIDGAQCRSGLCLRVGDDPSGACVEPCAADPPCPRGYSCDPIESVCVWDCQAPADCGPPADDGRGWGCNPETRRCDLLYACCAESLCTEVSWDACREAGGDALRSVATCDRDPCGSACDADDGCPAGRYCDVDDGRCAEGCRPNDPESCQPGWVCEAETHTCRALPCVGDADCAADRSCEAGLCLSGCRADPDNCPGDRICDPAQRVCVDPPCVADAACPPDAWCDAGVCAPGCREGADCGPPNGDGRARVCNADTRACEPLFACCVDDLCTEALPEVCAGDGGDVIEGLATCARDPCGAACAADRDCPADRYCNVEDGRCAEGCRLGDAASCQPGAICEPATRACRVLRCAGDAQCPADRFCDGAVCLPGCRANPDNCPDGRLCVDGICAVRCDPRAPPDDPAGCPFGAFCDPFTFTCFEECFEHADCDADRFCDAPSARCVFGCRDDEGEFGEPDNSPEAAVPIDLVADGGSRVGVADGRVVCGDDPDFYVVDLERGERLLIELTYDRAAGDLDLRLSGDEVGARPIAATGPAVPARVEFPAPGAAIDRAATFHVEVFPPDDDPARRIEYRVVVSAVRP